MSVHLPEERKSNILQELKKLMKRIKFKKCTPVRVLAKLIGKLSATRTQFTQASLYLKQLSDCLNIRVNKEGWNTYVPWEYRMIGEIKWWLKTIKTNKPRLISINPTFQAVITTDASPIAWGATFQAVNQNVRINPRKEMEKLSQSRNSIRKRKIILPNKFNEYQVELYRSDRTETESETSERISNSPKEMVKFYEKTDFKLKRDNSD
jgi:hypothetical protein